VTAVVSVVVAAGVAGEAGEALMDLDSVADLAAVAGTPVVIRVSDLAVGVVVGVVGEAAVTPAGIHVIHALALEDSVVVGEAGDGKFTYLLPKYNLCQ
jgi:hypothetical protein